MKISVKFYFNLRETELETQSPTLGALLDELASSYELIRTGCFDRDYGKIHDDCTVLVNRQPYEALTNGLDTKLGDGDKVEIVKFSPIAGG